jgi:hypothetical protein
MVARSKAGELFPAKQPQVLFEDILENVPEKSKTSLRLNKKMSLRNVQQVVLRRVSETIHHLRRERLIFSQKFDVCVGQTAADAGIKSNCLF